MNEETRMRGMHIFGHHLCWSAIFIGAFIGLGLGFLLHLYSLAIGLTAFTSSSSGAMTLTIGGLLGLLIGSIVSMGLAGFTTSFLAHVSHHTMGMIYGFTTWSVALFLAAVMALPLHHFLSSFTTSLMPVSISTEQSNRANVAEEERIKLSTPREEVSQVVTPKTVASTGWVVFILFVIGALSAAFGGCLAVKCHEKHCPSHRDPL